MTEIQLTSGATSADSMSKEWIRKKKKNGENENKSWAKVVFRGTHRHI